MSILKIDEGRVWQLHGRTEVKLTEQTETEKTLLVRS